jgi:hypothetical protein
MQTLLAKHGLPELKDCKSLAEVANIDRSDMNVSLRVWSCPCTAVLVCSLVDNGRTSANRITMTLREHRIPPSLTLSGRHPIIYGTSMQALSIIRQQTLANGNVATHGSADEVNSFVGCTLLIQVMQYDGTVPCAPFQSMDRGA